MTKRRLILWVGVFVATFGVSASSTYAVGIGIEECRTRPGKLAQ